MDGPFGGQAGGGRVGRLVFPKSAGATVGFCTQPIVDKIPYFFLPNLMNRSRHSPALVKPFVKFQQILACSIMFCSLGFPLW